MIHNRIRRIIRSPSFLLMAGYAIAQGSSFLLILILRSHVEADAVGRAVLYFGLFSLCFQFADFGNSPYGMRCLANGEEEKFRVFRLGRAIIAIPFVAITAYLTLEGTVPEHVWVMTTLTAAGVVLFALANPLRIEESGNYRSLALVQAIPWLLTSTVIWISFTTVGLSEEVGLLLWIFVPLIYYFKLIGHKGGVFRKSESNFRNDLASPLALLVPSLIGQFWGRWMLVIIAEVASLAVLGPLGLVRSCHTALCLAAGFIARPRMREIILVEHKRDRLSSFSIFGRIWKKVSPLLLLSILIVTIIVVQGDVIPDDIRDWVPILYGVPFWALGSLLTSANQATLNVRTFTVLDSAAMITHALVFLAIVSWNPVLAFVAADGGRFMANVAGTYLVQRLGIG